MLAKNDFDEIKFLKYKDFAQQVYCPMCEHCGLTTIIWKSKAQWRGFMDCVGCGFWLGCCFIPCCINSRKKWCTTEAVANIFYAKKFKVC